MDKRGQFFILTAVIVSALIFSISLTVNRATTQIETNKITDYTEILDRELAQVQNYQIYTKITEDSAETVEDFVDKVSATLLDQDPDLNFVVIYGSEKNITVFNKGSDGIAVDNQTISGTDASQSSIIVQTGSLTTSSSIGSKTTILNPNQNLTVQFEDNIYYFTIPEENIVIFMLQKEEQDENHITIK